VPSFGALKSKIAQDVIETPAVGNNKINIFCGVATEGIKYYI